MNRIRIRRTGAPDLIAVSDGRLTLSLPIRITCRSGRKLVTLPNGGTAKPRPWDLAAILEETLPLHIVVHDLAINPPVLWDEQRSRS